MEAGSSTSGTLSLVMDFVTLRTAILGLLHCCGGGGGLPKLRHFYRVYAPANLDEAWAPVYGAESTAIAQTAIDVWPWRYPSTGSHAELLHTLVPNSRPGARTGRKGPLSREQVEFEWERLCAVNESIRTLGFQQRFFGGILGHLLHDGTSGAWVFVVEQGQHRAAVLAYRGWQRVPVRLAQARGAIIDVNDIADATSQNAAKSCLDPINVALRQRLVTATFSDS